MPKKKPNWGPPVPDPTPNELASRIAAVQAGWTPEVRERRRAVARTPFELVPLPDSILLGETVPRRLPR